MNLSQKSFLNTIYGKQESYANTGSIYHRPFIVLHDCNGFPKMIFKDAIDTIEKEYSTEINSCRIVVHGFCVYPCETYEEVVKKYFS